MRILLPVVLTALLAAGCGDTKDPPVASRTPQPTAVAAARPSIVSDLNALCKRWQDRADKLNTRYTALATAGDLEGAARTLREGRDEQHAADEKVAALQPPQDEADALRRYLGARERLTRLLDELAAAVEKNDTATAQRLSGEFDRLRQARLDAALELGASECR